MRARGRVSVCNEMKVAIDKVAGANEQTVSEVRGWLMETRPKMGEKNCTRAAGKSGGGQAGLWAAEMKRLQAGWQWASLKQRARMRGERCRQASRQGGEPTDGGRFGGAVHTRRTPGTAVVGRPCVSSRCVCVCSITRCRRIVTLPRRCVFLHHTPMAGDSGKLRPHRALLSRHRCRFTRDRFSSA